MTPRLGGVSLDCADPAPLAAFWAALLDGEVVLAAEGFAAVRAGPVWVTAMAVEDYVPPTWPSRERPKQAHLELAVRKLEEEVTRAVSLGARLAEQQPNAKEWRVLLDPAGHPFCLTTQLPE